METIGRGNDDTVYVAVGKDVEESKPNLVWALCNARGRKICILHVHIPAQKIPFMAAMRLKDPRKEHRMREYHQIERQKIHRVLEEYTLICEQAGVVAEKLYAEGDSIENGIVELIASHGIEKLVMGAASNRLYARKIVELKSRKAIYVRVHAPAFCHILFIFKEQLIYTRSRSGGINNKVVSLLHRASPSTETGHSSSSRSKYVTEAQKVQPLTDIYTECLSIRSDNDGVQFDANSPTEAAGEVTPHRNSSAEGGIEIWDCILRREEGIDIWDGILRGTSFADSYFSTCSPSKREDDSTSISFTNIENERSKIDEGHDHSSPPSNTEQRPNHEIYGKLEQYASEMENFKQKAYEESISCKKAEKETIEALQRANTFKTMHDEELKQKIEFEEVLARVIEEVEKLKWHLEEVKDDLQDAQEQKTFLECHIADSDKMVNELEQKALSAAELLQKFKKQRDELQVKRDNALKVAEELREQQAEEISLSSMPQFFAEISLSEIQEATRNFDPTLKIMEGDYKCTYRGFLRNTQVAIKMLQPYRWQGTSKFHQEVSILSRLRHPNLVTLIGVCPEARTLIYEYFPNGSLEHRLSCKDNTPPLSWQTRIQIAAELCSVLIFLHSSTPNPFIYGDLKTFNILLDANYVAKLSDLGIFRPRSDANDSFAYMDPEFLATGGLTPQSNVYSFGIILLRLLTGRPASGLMNKVQNALDEGKLKDLLDSTAGDWPFVQANQLAHLAMSCCEMKPWCRPDLASEVWRVLEPMTASCRISSFQSGSGEDRPIPPSFLCPIYQEVMQDPVIASDGFSYEAEAIKAWFVGGHVTSPMTNLRLAHCKLVPNHALRSAIQAWLQHP